MIVRGRRARRAKRPIGHTVEFSTQPERQYTFWEDELNDGGEGNQEWLELAYAVTIHKSAGLAVQGHVRRDPGPLSAALARAALHGADPPAGQGGAAQAGSTANLRELGAPARSDDRSATDVPVPASRPVRDRRRRARRRSHPPHGPRRAVRSKSEVIVADALADVLDRSGSTTATRRRSTFPGEYPRRPDFTIARPGKPTVYWEHLGMLDLAGYRADWEARKEWYAHHDILPWTDGGGPAERSCGPKRV